MKKILLIAVLLLADCTTLTRTAPDGTTLKYSSFGSTDTLRAGDVVLTGKSDIDPTALIGAVVK